MCPRTFRFLCCVRAETFIFYNIFFMLAGLLGARAVAILSSASTSVMHKAKQVMIWNMFATKEHERLGKYERLCEFERLVESFALRNYSHPSYRAFRWLSQDYSCVWRNWTFDLSRANGWSTDRRMRVWDYFMNSKAKVWFPLPKNYRPLWWKFGGNLPESWVRLLMSDFAGTIWQFMFFPFFLFIFSVYFFI